MNKLFWMGLSILFLLSCKKEEGEGGRAIIKGKVYGYDINSSGFKQDSAYVQNERVFISYGDHIILDDDVRTSIDGSFEFDHLQKGNYTLWVFGYSPSKPLQQYFDSITVFVSSSQEVVVTRDLITYFK